MPTATTFETDERRFQLFTLVFGVVTASLPLILWAVGQFTIRRYSIIVLIWLLASSEVFAPTSPDTQWWNRLQWVKVAGWIVLGYILFERYTMVV